MAEYHGADVLNKVGQAHHHRTTRSGPEPSGAGGQRPTKDYKVAADSGVPVFTLHSDGIFMLTPEAARKADGKPVPIAGPGWYNPIHEDWKNKLFKCDKKQIKGHILITEPRP